MNHMRAAEGLLVLMLATGCSVGGDAGVLHQALLKDQVEDMAHDGCPEEDIRAVCGPRFIGCMEDCKKAMEKRGWK